MLECRGYAVSTATLSSRTSSNTSCALYIAGIYRYTGVTLYGMYCIDGKGPGRGRLMAAARIGSEGGVPDLEVFSPLSRPFHNIFENTAPLSLNTP